MERLDHRHVIVVVILLSSLQLFSHYQYPRSFTAGTLSGYVYKFGTVNPLEGATVEIPGLTGATTNSAGFYQITGIPAGIWEATAGHPDFCDQTVSGIVITSGGTTFQDFELTWAEISTIPDPGEGFVVTLPENITYSSALEITNPGSCDLVFEITLEGLTEIFGGPAPDVNEEIIAYGTPVPLDQVCDLPTSINKQDIDAARPFKVNPNVKSPDPSEEEDIFGSAENMYGPLQATCGNFFSVTSPTTLLEHRLWLNATSVTDMMFCVWESPFEEGTYSMISASDVSPQGPGGPGWYSSGQLEVPLQQGYKYIIAASWDGDLYYYNEQNITPYPIQASFGTLFEACGWNWAPPPGYPPDPQLNVSVLSGDPVAYYQSIVTGIPINWFWLDFYSGTVPPDSTLVIPAHISAVGYVQGSVKTGTLSISSNAFPDDVLEMNLKMTVEAPLIGNFFGSVYEFNTSTPVAGALVVIDDGILPPQSTTTNSVGYFEFIDIYLLYPMMVTISADGFCTYYDTIAPPENGYGLTWAEMSLEPASLNLQIPFGESGEKYLLVTNTASCELIYEAEINYISAIPENWIEIIQNASGSVPPFTGNADTIVLQIDAGGLPLGTVKNAEIILTSNDRYDSVKVVPVTMTVVDGYELELTSCLEGAFDEATGQMSSQLPDQGVVPFFQPYGPPLPYYGNPSPEWYYTGSDSVTGMNPEAVDWVLVDVRDAPDAQSANSSTTVIRFPAFLMKDGTVRSLDFVSRPFLSDMISQGLFVVIQHRNHLSIMNSSPIPLQNLTFSWDYTSGGIFGGSLAAKEVAPGVWAARGGDGNADGDINTQDKLDAWWIDAASSGYLGGDFDMNGQAGNQDKVDVWMPNSGMSGQVPN